MKGSGIGSMKVSSGEYRGLSRGVYSERLKVADFGVTER